MTLTPQFTPMSYEYILATDMTQLERARMATEDYDGGARGEYMEFRARQLTEAVSLDVRVAQLGTSTLGADISTLVQKVSAAKNADADAIKAFRETLQILRRRQIQEKIDNVVLKDEAKAHQSVFIILTTAEGVMKNFPRREREETAETRKTGLSNISSLQAHEDGWYNKEVALGDLRTTLQTLEDKNIAALRDQGMAGYLQHGAGSNVSAPKVAKFRRKNAGMQP